MAKKLRRVLFDTSVLLPALVEKHPRHAEAARRLGRAHDGKIHLVISAHTLAELYSMLTTLPVSPRIGPDEARELISQNVRSRAEVVSLDAADYDAVVDKMTEMGLPGGIIYDALHVHAARKAVVDRLWTFNGRDFLRIWPDHGGVIEDLRR